MAAFLCVAAASACHFPGDEDAPPDPKPAWAAPYDHPDSELLDPAPLAAPVMVATEGQEITPVLEYYFASFAWRRVHYGTVIDVTGRVWHFDYGKLWVPEASTRKGWLSGKALRRKYAGAVSWSRVDPESLEHALALIPETEYGLVSVEGEPSPDAGGGGCRALVWDADHDQYRRFLLAAQSAGTVRARNLSLAAEELDAWLRAVVASTMPISPRQDMYPERAQRWNGR